MKNAHKLERYLDARLDDYLESMSDAPEICQGCNTKQDLNEYDKLSELEYLCPLCGYINNDTFDQ